MNATATTQAIRAYHLNREEARIAAYRVRRYQRLMLQGVDVSDNLDTAIDVERAMRAAHEATLAEMVNVLPGLLVAATERERV